MRWESDPVAWTFAWVAGAAALAIILLVSLMLFMSWRSKKQYARDMAEHVARVQERANARQVTARMSLSEILGRLARDEDIRSDTADVPDKPRFGRHALPEEDGRWIPPGSSRSGPEIPAQAGSDVARSGHGGAHVPHHA